MRSRLNCSGRLADPDIHTMLRRMERKGERRGQRSGKNQAPL